MGSFRAPGVQIKEVDLSEVVRPVGTSVGALVGPTYKGPTNRRVLITGNSNFAEVFGKPVSGVSAEYPMYCGLEFLKESDFMYFVRPANSDSVVGGLTLDTSCSATRTTAKESGEGMWAGEFADGNKPTLYYAGEQLNDLGLNIVALGASNYNDDVGISIITENDVETDSMDYTYGYSWKGKYPEKNSAGADVHYYRVNVYVKDHQDSYEDAKWDSLSNDGKDPSKTLVPVESWIVSNDPLAKDYQGNSMYAKTVINGNSNYIYVNPNGQMDTSATYFTEVENWVTSAEISTNALDNSTEIESETVSWTGSYNEGTLSWRITGDWEEITSDVMVTSGGIEFSVTTTGDNSGDITIPISSVATSSASVARKENNDIVYTIVPVNAMGAQYTDCKPVIGEVVDGKFTVSISCNQEWDYDTLSACNSEDEKPGKVFATEFSSVSTGQKVANIAPLAKGVYDIANQTNGITEAWQNLFKSKEQCTPNILMAPYVNDNSISDAVQTVAEIANTRKDCFAVLPCGGLKTTDAVALVDSLNNMSYARNSYCAMYAGADLVYDQYTNARIYLPKVCFAGRIIAHNDNVANVWNAPAGLQRGAMNTLDALKVFSEQEIGFMYNSNINTSKRVRGAGDFVWGQKTGQVKATALDRINVRRLLLYIENSIEPMLQGYLFENNTPTLRGRVKSNIDAFMETVYSAGGVYSWNCVCDESNNTAQVIDNNELAVDLFISPARSIEYINVRVIITRTGVSMEEV